MICDVLCVVLCLVGDVWYVVVDVWCVMCVVL